MTDCNANSGQSVILKKLVQKVKHLEVDFQHLQKDDAISLFPYMTELYVAFAARVHPVASLNGHSAHGSLKIEEGGAMSKACECKLVLLASPDIADVSHIPYQRAFTSQHHLRALSKPSGLTKRWQTLNDLQNLVLEAFPSYPLADIGYEMFLQPPSRNGSLRLVDESVNMNELTSFVADGSNFLFVRPHTYLVFPSGSANSGEDQQQPQDTEGFEDPLDEDSSYQQNANFHVDRLFGSRKRKQHRTDNKVVSNGTLAGVVKRPAVDAPTPNEKCTPTSNSMSISQSIIEKKPTEVKNEPLAPVLMQNVDFAALASSLNAVVGSNSFLFTTPHFANPVVSEYSGFNPVSSSFPSSLSSMLSQAIPTGSSPSATPLALLTPKQPSPPPTTQISLNNGGFQRPSPSVAPSTSPSTGSHTPAGDESTTAGGGNTSSLSSFLLHQTTSLPQNSMGPHPHTNSNHILCRIPPTKKKMRPTKRCEQCRKTSDRRKESRYYCSTCGKGFHRECFISYHEEAGCSHYEVAIEQTTTVGSSNGNGAGAGNGIGNGIVAVAGAATGARAGTGTVQTTMPSPLAVQSAALVVSSSPNC